MHYDQINRKSLTTYKRATVDQGGTENRLAKNSARTVLTDSRLMADCKKIYIFVDYTAYQMQYDQKNRMNATRALYDLM
jgi:hypothetical protein